MDDRLAEATEAARRELSRQLGDAAAERVDCGELVRAVAAILREPTPAMVDAGRRIHELEGDRIDLSPEIPKMWRAMLDVAVDGGKGEAG